MSIGDWIGIILQNYIITDVLEWAVMISYLVIVYSLPMSIKTVRKKR